MSARVNGDQALTECLTAEGGPLAVGAMPVAPTANEEGAKALVEAVSSQEAKTVKTKKPKKETPVENAEPKSVQQCLSNNQEVL